MDWQETDTIGNLIRDDVLRRETMDAREERLDVEMPETPAYGRGRSSMDID